MRYPTVLFDLDGTLIDSGEIILSSFRHATKTVLAREIPDEVLAAAVGGSNIYEQMRAFDEERVDELVRVYREHNEPLHDDLVAFEGIERVLGRLKSKEGGLASSPPNGGGPSTSPSRSFRSNATSTPS